MIRMMGLVSAPNYHDTVVSAIETIEQLIEHYGDKISNVKVYWKPFNLDGEYHIKIYYDWEV